MSYLALPASLEYLCYGSTAIKMFYVFSAQFTSKSDVYRRQIQTYKHGPRTERVKTFFSYGGDWFHKCQEKYENKCRG